ncbi:MAG: hypothetical protein Aureis2KO_26590 [Aureisphaera sp.]
MKKVLIVALLVFSFSASLSCSPEPLDSNEELYGPGIEPMGADKGPVVDPYG